MMGVFYPLSFTDPLIFLSYGHNAGGAKRALYTPPTTGVLTLWDGLAGTSGPAMDLGRSVWLALSYDGATARAYLNGRLVISAASATPPSATIDVGRDANGGWYNGRWEAIKIWAAVLSEMEIQRETRQILPVRTASLNTFSPCRSLEEAALNYAGAHDFWTLIDSPTVEPGAGFPWELPRSRRVSVTSAVPVAGDEGFAWYRALAG